MSSILVAVKLDCQASCRILEWALRSLADRGDVIHVVCILMQTADNRAADRQQAQDKIRKQFGSLLKGRLHRLHIVRVLHASSEACAPYIARAICAKATMLAADVIVVGGKARVSASGGTRSSAVAEAVRKHSRRPVLLISAEHPLLARTLPVIAEEPHSAEATLDAKSCLLLSADSLSADSPTARYGDENSASQAAYPRAGAGLAVPAC